MASRDNSFTRLREGKWTSDGAVLAAIADSSAKFQTLADGSGTYVYDAYTVTMLKMPPDLTAEAYLLEFAKSPNTAVNNGAFNTINKFTKRTTTDPKIGDIYDIDIMGPDNGSIVLVVVGALATRRATPISTSRRSVATSTVRIPRTAPVSRLRVRGGRRDVLPGRLAPRQLAVRAALPRRWRADRDDEGHQRGDLRPRRHAEGELLHRDQFEKP